MSGKVTRAATPQETAPDRRLPHLHVFLAETSGAEHRESRWRHLLCRPADVTQSAAECRPAGPSHRDAVIPGA